MSEMTPLPDDPAVLKQMIAELLDQLRSSRRNEEQLRAKVDELVRKLFGRKSEKINPDQLSLIDLESLGISPAQDEPAQTVPELEPPSKWRKPKRRKPPKELRRRRVEHTLPEAERLCPCCKDPMQPIREETHEQLDYRPSSFEVVEHVRFVYGCRQRCDEAVEVATKPPQMIDKGLPGPGLLAHVITSKYANHLPLYRLEGIFQREGVEIARSTMTGWIAACSKAVGPLIDHMRKDLLRSHVIATDDTPVPVQSRKSGGCRKGRLWVYVGDEEHPWILYDYTPTRGRDGPMEFLEGFEGYLQADGYAGYDEIYRTRRVVEVGCWMHARRYFYDASQADPARPCEALAIIRELYKIEKKVKDLDSDARLALRQEKAVPLLDTMEEWIARQIRDALPKSPLGKALTYADNQWAALRRYTKDGRLSMDNGRSERALRPIAVGRKNWLFAGSDAGGQRAARLYTLIESCRRHRLDPFRYLRDLFRRLPEHPSDQIDELTPLAWAAEQKGEAEG